MLSTIDTKPQDIYILLALVGEPSLLASREFDPVSLAILYSSIIMRANIVVGVAFILGSCSNQASTGQRHHQIGDQTKKLSNHLGI